MGLIGCALADHASIGTRVRQVICSSDGQCVCVPRLAGDLQPQFVSNWSAACRANETDDNVHREKWERGPIFQSKRSMSLRETAAVTAAATAQETT